MPQCTCVGIPSITWVMVIKLVLRLGVRWVPNEPALQPSSPLISKC